MWAWALGVRVQPGRTEKDWYSRYKGLKPSDFPIALHTCFLSSTTPGLPSCISILIYESWFLAFVGYFLLLRAPTDTLELTDSYNIHFYFPDEETEIPRWSHLPKVKPATQLWTSTESYPEVLSAIPQSLPWRLSWYLPSGDNTWAILLLNKPVRACTGSGIWQPFAVWPSWDLLLPSLLSLSVNLIIFPIKEPTFSYILNQNLRHSHSSVTDATIRDSFLWMQGLFPLKMEIPPERGKCFSHLQCSMNCCIRSFIICWLK